METLGHDFGLRDWGRLLISGLGWFMFHGNVTVIVLQKY